MLQKYSILENFLHLLMYFVLFCVNDFIFGYQLNVINIEFRGNNTFNKKKNQTKKKKQYIAKQLSVSIIFYRSDKPWIYPYFISEKNKVSKFYFFKLKKTPMIF